MTVYSKSLMMGVAAAALLAGQAWAQSAPRVGVVSAVNPAAVGTPPGAEARPIVVGSDVIFHEKMVTTSEGQAQLMFLDQSTLMIGPNSQVVIDEFIFDPGTSTGKFAATLTQGSFRYIGGKLSKQGDATLRTPVATIGIRGSDVVIRHDANTNASGIQNIHGNATVQSNGATVKLPTGFGTQINGAGQSPTYPAALTAAIINAAKTAFEGLPGRSAGAPKPPQNDDVAKSGLGDAVEAARLAAIETAAGGGANGGQPPRLPYINNAPLDQPGVPPGTTQPTTTSNTPPAENPVGGVRNGYVGGIAVTLLGEAIALQTVSNSAASDVAVNITPSSGSTPGTVNARLQFSTQGGASPQTIAIDFATLAGPNGQPVSDSNFLAINQSGMATVNGTSTQASGIIGTQGRFFGIEELSIENIQNVSVCDCTFMSWGSWLATLQTPGQTELSSIILGTFVTGLLPTIAVQPTGTATFTGHAVGTSSTNSNLFTAGNVNVSWNFGARNGNLQITNFDGNNMQGAINAPPSDWRHYSGSLSRMPGSSGPANSGAVNGSFFVAPGQAAGAQPAGTGGNFTLKGSEGYRAGGVFLGRNTNIPSTPSSGSGFSVVSITP